MARQRRRIAVPFDRDAEESLIGAMLLSGDTRRRAIAEVDAEDLWLPELRRAFETIRGLHYAGGDVDPVTVHAALVAGDGDGVGGKVLSVLDLGTLAGDTPASVNVSSYGGIVRDQARLRAAILLGERLAQAGHEQDLTAVGHLAAEAETRLAPPPLHAPTDDLLELWELADREAEEPSKPWAIAGCLRAEEVVLITGTEGGGKATLLRQCLACVASGVHPFTGVRGFPRERVLFVDLQESRVDMAEEVVKLREALRDDARPGFYKAYATKSLDLASSTGRRLLEGLVMDHRPTLVAAGPLVRLFRAQPGQSRYDESLVNEVHEFLDDLMGRYGFALMLEGHAGVSREDAQDWRQRGSGAWLSWPAFSFGLRSVTTESNLREVEVIRARRVRYTGRGWPRKLYEFPEHPLPWNLDGSDLDRLHDAMTPRAQQRPLGTDGEPF